MAQQSGTLKGIVWPAVFTACAAWIIWYFPRYLLLLGLGSERLTIQYIPAGMVDLLVLGIAAIALVLGIRSADTTTGEGELKNVMDRLSLFVGRISMLLVVILVAVMFYEVIVRYIFEQPTLWANELSLWLAGFIFLLAGLYAMQQRSHIRIFLLYDVMPRWLQRICDTVSALLISVFAFAMIWGGYNEARDKVLRWETFGTAFDPPIPATLKPMVLVIISLVAVQALVNLVADWSKEPEVHGVVDEGEIEEFLEHARHQHEVGRHD